MPHLAAADCSVEDLAALVRRTPDLGGFPLAKEVVDGVLVYDAAALLARARSDGAGLAQAEDELVRALTDGPGIVVLEAAFPDEELVDRVTAAFEAIIEREKAAGGSAGDHFAKPGANDRVWNALQKLALADPEAFVDYYASDALALVSTAWLGPAYQVTSQVNVVRPGGRAQDPHRDYHLGFLADEVVERYPAHVHRLSPVLTLQGAVAHSDMPVRSGPTMYLPYSHQYEPGYLAWRRADFRDFFAEHHVQLPLEKGDAAFFNPAVLHGAGSNVSPDVQRVANLLQVSSAFGRAMEAVDRTATVLAVYPALRARCDAGWPPHLVGNVVEAAAEGYPFPTDLDRDQPVDGLTPMAQTGLLRQALDGRWPVARLRQALADHAARRSGG